MNEQDDCLSIFRRLVSLMEEDSREISHCLKGDLTEQYRSLLKAEMANLETARKLLQKHY